MTKIGQIIYQMLLSMRQFCTIFGSISLSCDDKSMKMYGQKHENDLEWHGMVLQKISDKLHRSNRKWTKRT